MFTTLLLACFALPAQDVKSAPLPEGIVAVWDGGQIETTHFERFLGRSFKNKQLGTDALRHILQIQLVELEAERRGLAVPPELLKDRIAQASKEAKKAGYELDALLQSRGLSTAKFSKLMGDSILHEIMVRQDLAMPEGSAIPDEDMMAWTEDHLKNLLKRAASAPEGFALDAAPYRVNIQELGETLREILGPTRKKEYLLQLVLETHLPSWAEQKGVVLTDDILQAEIDWRTRRVESNPAYGGATYTDLLRTQGATIESIRQGNELRLAGYLRLYSEELFDNAWFQKLVPEVRQQLMDEYGDKRHISWFFLNATDEKKTEIDLDFNQAAQELKTYATRISDEESFAQIAEQYSEHEETRRRKGEMGWISRTGAGVDPELAKAAFEAPIGTLYGPIRAMNGMALLWVHDIMPIATEKEFQDGVRRGRHVEIRKRILERIKLRTVYDRQMPTQIEASGN